MSESTHQIGSNLSGRLESVIEDKNLIRVFIERGANAAEKITALAAVLGDSLVRFAQRYLRSDFLASVKQSSGYPRRKRAAHQIGVCNQRSLMIGGSIFIGTTVGQMGREMKMTERHESLNFS